MSSNNPFKNLGRPGIPSNPFAAQPQAVTAQTRPSKKKKKGKRKRVSRDHFERRFLSEHYTGGAGALEVAMLWSGNIFSIDQYKGNKDITLTMGSDEDVTYPVDHPGIDAATPFAAQIDGQWTLTFTTQARGFVLLGTRKLSFAKAVEAGAMQQHGDTYVLPVQNNTRAKLVLGEVSFLVHYISVPALVIPAFAGIGAASIVLGLFVSLLVHGIFGSFVAFDTDLVEELTLDQLSTNAAFAEALITPESEEQAKEEEPEEQDSEELAPTEDAGQKAADDEGAAGKPTETAEAGSIAIAGDSDSMALKRQYDTAVARGAGVLAQENAMASLLGSAPTAEGYDNINAWGDFATTVAGDKHGTYGLGMQGTGRGGGGDQFGVFGPGEIGTVGRSNGEGPGGADYARDVVHLEPKKTVKPVLERTNPEVGGGLDRRIIRKVINQHKNEIKRCYERELLKDNTLHGKIEIKFMIDPTGNVQTASLVSSSMSRAGGKKVGACLTRAIKSWRFPTPKNGSLVKVTYPFVFSNGLK